MRIPRLEAIPHRQALMQMREIESVVCDTTGHDWAVVELPKPDNRPTFVLCNACGKAFRVAS